MADDGRLMTSLLGDPGAGDLVRGLSVGGKAVTSAVSWSMSLPLGTRLEVMFDGAE